MDVTHYDYRNFLEILVRLKSGDTSNTVLENLKDELNKFFKDSKCLGVLYTKNTDNLFFGMITIPVISEDDAVEFIRAREPKRIDQYYIELDSKLFDPVLDLEPRELLSILLHEVGHVVNDNKAPKQVISSIDAYLAVNNESITISDSVHYRAILAYAIKDAINKATSMFYLNKNQKSELDADKFVHKCGFGRDLECAFIKILRKTGTINRNVTNKFVVLQWTLRLYNNIGLQRLIAIKTLNKGKALTGSKLEKNEMDKLIANLRRIDDDSVVEENAMIEKVLTEDSFFKNFRTKGMKSLENDLFELKLRAKNIEDEDDALMLIRQLNNKIGIIDEYIITTDLSEKEKKHWEDVLSEYIELRAEFAKKKTYTKKYYGVFVQYPDTTPNQLHS